MQGHLEGRADTEDEMLEKHTYTVDETAALLGIGRNAAYEAIKRGELPALRIGRRIVVPRAALDQLLNAAVPHPRTAA